MYNKTLTAKCSCVNLCVITARKRSLGQGNMFTGVCLSTGGAWSGGVAWSMGRGCLVWGVPALGGGVPDPGGVPPSPNGYCCGRYASYWNAFLFTHDFCVEFTNDFHDISIAIVNHCKKNIFVSHFSCLRIFL